MTSISANHRVPFAGTQQVARPSQQAQTTRSLQHEPSQEDSFLSEMEVFTERINDSTRLVCGGAAAEPHARTQKAASHAYVRRIAATADAYRQRANRAPVQTIAAKERKPPHIKVPSGALKRLPHVLEQEPHFHQRIEGSRPGEASQTPRTTAATLGLDVELHGAAESQPAAPPLAPTRGLERLALGLDTSSASTETVASAQESTPDVSVIDVLPQTAPSPLSRPSPTAQAAASLPPSESAPRDSTSATTPDTTAHPRDVRRLELALEGRTGQHLVVEYVDDDVYSLTEAANRSLWNTA